MPALNMMEGGNGNDENESENDDAPPTEVAIHDIIDVDDGDGAAAMTGRDDEGGARTPSIRRVRPPP